MTSKTVYQTDRAGMYIGITEADDSPLEPGVFLIPAGAVEAAPPRAWPDTQWPRWNGVAWELVARHTPASGDVAADKLRAFLSSNPDVVQLIGK
ncbi:phage tail protein [Burkholderia plantarii]|uniref:phage tail protein n=1 Tax=Burkholderia plantarii TaxID=41899 RepID=UPI00272BE843|nr:phage tail protein [Burkholderia plantarii]WLE59283.1 phage tail protein [Burkholderia plantarii]